MDVSNILKKVNSINEYVAVTENFSAKCKTSKIELNMSNVLALIKIRSLEIEHINKCDQNGIACIIFERMLCLPPSKTWEVLSKEMVNVLQYWLDAVRKHLIKHSAYWWTFLKSLLIFTREIHTKGNTVSNILVEHISECLLDLATVDRPDAMQRYEILHCFNLFCCESSREVRLALRRQFEQYFTKLAAYMCSCGHLPTQYSILETLLRWLVPRQDRTLRVTSATKWFPTKMYADSTVDIFLERSWMDFYQDARDFLNTHNMSSDIITSVVCTKLSVGNAVIISGKQYKDSWLDVNSITKCISVLLNPRVLDAFGGTTSYKSFETLIVAYDNIHSVKFYRENEELLLSIHTISTPCIVPSQVKLGDDDVCDVTAIITSHCDHKRLDAALRKIFDDRYQLLIDLEELTVPPIIVPEPSSSHASVEPRSLSHKEKLPLRSGIKLRNPIPFKSPSSTSTTSLAQLHERLAELPRLTFVREPKIISANPKLSAVTEVSETDDRSTSTFKHKRFGTCIIKRNTLNNKRDWRSDNESFRRKSEVDHTFTDREILPIIDDNDTSSLLVATIGSADESVIYNKIESITKSQYFNGDNIIDLLMQEASSAQVEKEKHRAINTDEKNLNSQFEIEDTPNVGSKNIKGFKGHKNFKPVSSTSDESNTEIISDTPNVYVTTRRNYKDITKSVTTEKTLDDKLVEQYFSEHASKNEVGDVISPTLARKVNETSSENSADFLDNNLIVMDDDLQDVELVDFEVLECLNNIVDKVCIDLDKCTQFMYNECNPANRYSDFEDSIPLQDIMNLNIGGKKNQTTTKKSNPQNIKLKYKKSKMNSRGTKDKNKPKSASKSKMSIIVEDNAEVDESNNIPQQCEQNITEVHKDLRADNTTEATTPLLRKKRKLFSPKDEVTDKVVPMHLQSKETDFTDSSMNKTPKSSNIYKAYKEPERKSQTQIRFLRNRKARTIETTSPRSKKLNELFDKVKKSTDGEQVTLVKNTNKFEVFNFSSDSEDDFKTEKTIVSKLKTVAKKSSAAISDNEVIVPRRSRTVKRANSSNKSRNNTKRKVNRKRKVQKKISTEADHELIDEKMREARDVLNASFVIDQPKSAVTEPDPIIQKASEIEVINDNNSDLNECQQKTQATKKNKMKDIHLPKEGKNTHKKSDVDDDRTVSPLPGLVVEEEATKNKDDEMPPKMVEKLKKICQNSEKYINVSNTTHNLLSDNERNMYSPENRDVDDEMCAKTDNNSQFTSKPKTFYSKKLNVSNDEEISSNKDTYNLRSRNISRSKSKSVHSIGTVSITGHGDSDEVPPSPNLIAQKIEPRNLDTEYLDAPMKDYCKKLSEEINGLNINFNDSTKTSKSLSSNKSDKQTDKVLNKAVNSPISLQSPVVSIDRISIDNIKKWLPSSRTSASGSQSDTSKKSKLNNAILEEKKHSKIVKSAHGTDSVSHEDLQEPIKRSLRSFQKSPGKKQSRNDVLFGTNVTSASGSQSDTSKKSKLNNAILEEKKHSKIVKSAHGTDSVSHEDLQEPIKRSLRSFQKSPGKKQSRNDVLFGTNVSTISSELSVNKLVKKKSRIQPPRSAKCTQRSVISPIKLFDDLTSNVDKMSETHLSDDEDFMAIIKETSRNIYKSREQECSKNPKNNTIMKTLTQNKNVETKNKLVASSIDSESIRSKISCSSKKDNSSNLKRRLEEKLGCHKKKKVENTVSESALTASSIDDWFKRNETDNSKSNVRDCILYVLEKLDTTLIGIQQNTSQKLGQLLVSAYQRWSEINEEKHRMYKTVASDILTSVVKVIDEKFNEMDKKSQEQDRNFLNHLKQQSLEFIKEDCLQKRVMVQLLREDLKAVLEHERRTRNSD